MGPNLIKIGRLGRRLYARNKQINSTAPLLLFHAPNVQFSLVNDVSNRDSRTVYCQRAWYYLLRCEP